MILGATLTPMDIIIAAVIIFGTYYGATQGIFKKTTMIVSILAGVILGIRFRGLVEGFLNRNFYMSISPEAISLLGFILAFVIVYILVNQLLVSLGGVLGRAKIGIDQALGALLGGGLTTFVLSILLFLSAKLIFPPA